MRFKWIIPGAVALLALALAVLWLQGVSQAQTPLAGLMITKTVDTPVVAPDESVIYTVMLSNTTGATLEVSSLVDTLPNGFEYIGLAPGSEWQKEPTVTLPELRWDGPLTVSASSAVTLCYSVYIPPHISLSGSPYTNTVVATVGQDTYQDEAAVLVGIGEVSVVKAATPATVHPGTAVTYTITFSNSGYVTVPLEVVTDVLPAQITFAGMTGPSDVKAPPTGVTGTVTWTGPFTIPASDQFVIEFRADTPVTSDTLMLKNRAWGRLGDGAVVSDSVEIEVRDTSTKTIYLPWVLHSYAPAVFTVTKTADPTTVYNEDPGGLTTYEIVFTNEGTDLGVLADIRDTLPAGFVFQNMMTGSDVTTPPSGTQGEIVWTGPFTVPGKSSLKLIYQVRASTVIGTYENSVTASVSEGRPLEALATASVQVVEPTLLVENWDSPSPYWEPFVNYWRLNWLQWHVDGWIGKNGSAALNHTYFYGVADPADGAHDALFMYRGPGAEEWRNYRFETAVKLNVGEIQGLWFRGKYEPSELGGRHVEGYYLAWSPGGNWIKLLRITHDGNYPYHFSNPTELVKTKYQLYKGVWYDIMVEVRDDNIKAYIDGNLVIDHDDSMYAKGTIGFKTYKFADGAWDNVVVTQLP